MFTDLPEGQTNFDPQAELDGQIQEFIRDITRAGFMPKSEATRRIYGLIEQAKEATNLVETSSKLVDNEASGMREFSYKYPSDGGLIINGIPYIPKHNLSLLQSQLLERVEKEKEMFTPVYEDLDSAYIDGLNSSVKIIKQVFKL